MAGHDLVYSGKRFAEPGAELGARVRIRDTQDQGSVAAPPDVGIRVAGTVVNDAVGIGQTLDPRVLAARAGDLRLVAGLDAVLIVQTGGVGGVAARAGDLTRNTELLQGTVTVVIAPSGEGLTARPHGLIRNAGCGQSTTVISQTKVVGFFAAPPADEF